MGWRLKIGRAAGIDVFLHWTFALAPVYVIYSCWENGWAMMGVMLVLLLCFFACVLLHEFGHALHSLLSSSKFHYLSGTRAEVSRFFLIGDIFTFFFLD